MSIVSVSSHQLYRWYHSHCMCDITSSVCEPFCPLYLWHHTHYVWHHNPLCWLHHTRHMNDIICITEDITSTLSHQATIFTNSHPLQAWHHTPCIRHRTNCIFVITTSPLISHPLLYENTPTICMTSYALYITSYPWLVITLLYLWQHKLEIWNHIQYAVQNIHYPCDITDNSLCHSTHCFESITPTLCMTSHSALI